ncbi:Cmr1 protein [Martiniozyma asiatica (nom. inval.)]|nr:Cmr1 protein [Martiniozyma asiatica]
MVSEFERQREENILRNKELLKELNLQSLAQEFGESKKKIKPKSVKSKKLDKYDTKFKPDSNLPLRRSRRIAGVKIEPEMIKDEDEIADTVGLNGDQLPKIEQRITNDFKLSDLIKDENKLKNLGDKFSAADFYNDIKDKVPVSSDLKGARDSLDNLQLYDNFPPNKIQIVSSRITTMEFHPSNKRKILIGGDKLGELGIWTIDDDTPDDPEPSITKFQPHIKNIPRIRMRVEAPEEVITCSYDGTMRTLNLQKGASILSMDFADRWGDPTGISDFHFIDKNVGFITTLDGEGMKFDLREAPLKRSNHMWRLHDKKIGYSTICPTNSNLFASASLDRTMRIWDLRMIQNQHWSSFEHDKSPKCIASYSSRLSVSTVDWNKSGDIVCNGYDDSIRIFNLNKNGKGIENYLNSLVKSETGEISENIKPDQTIVHNCKTGRWVTILKSRWQSTPSDGVEKFVIANMKKYLDVYSADGTMLTHLSHDYMTSIPAACVFHPSENWIAGGNNSGKTFLFT